MRTVRWIAVVAGLAAALAAGLGYYLPEVPLPVLVAGMAAAGVGAGGVAFFLLRRLLVERLRRMQKTLRRVAQGNYIVRCEVASDELGELAGGINHVLQKLTDLSVNVIDADRELQWAQKELKLTEKLAEKGKLLQATNAQLEARLRELSLLFSTSRALGSSLELPAQITGFCQTVGKSLGVDRFSIMVYEPARRVLSVAGTYGFGDAGASLQGMTFQPGEGVCGSVYEQKTMLYVRSLESDDRFLHFRGRVRLRGSALALPLMTAEQCMGVLLMQRNGEDAFSFDDFGLYHIVGNQIAGAVANSLLYAKTRELATHDELTGLHNRRAFESRLEMEWERALRFSTVLSCIMIDVDRFKKFNDDYGHLVGDEVLRHAGTVVLACVRKVDTVARFGGEEFALLLPRTTTDEAEAVAEKLRASVEGAVMPSGTLQQRLGITISLGVSSTQDGPASATELVDMADRALLVAKTTGRNRVVTHRQAGVSTRSDSAP